MASTSKPPMVSALTMENAKWDRLMAESLLSDDKKRKQEETDEALIDAKAFRAKVRAQCLSDQVNESLMLMVFVVLYLFVGTIFFAATEGW